MKGSMVNWKARGYLGKDRQFLAYADQPEEMREK
jgi:hypothetical protein